MTSEFWKDRHKAKRRDTTLELAVRGDSEVIVKFQYLIRDLLELGRQQRLVRYRMELLPATTDRLMGKHGIPVQR